MNDLISFSDPEEEEKENNQAEQTTAPEKDEFATFKVFDEIKVEHSIKSMACYILTPKGKVPVNVIVDSGSNTSNIDESLVNELGLKPASAEFDRTVRYVTGTVTYPTAAYEFDLVSQDGRTAQRVTAFRVKGFESIVPNWNRICKTHNYLEDINIPNTKDNVAKILIGTDCETFFEPLEHRKGQNNGPSATKNTNWVVISW